MFLHRRPKTELAPAIFKPGARLVSYLRLLRCGCMCVRPRGHE